MNKYYKLSNLIILIILVFTSFFIWTARATSSAAEIKVVTTKGKAEHLKDVSFYGHSFNPNTYSSSNSSSFQFQENNAEYLQDRSFIEQIDGYSEIFIDDLISNYRSFMRGKNPNANQYVLTDDWLVYNAMKSDVYWSEHSSNEITIAALNLKTEKEEEFSIPLGGPEENFNLQTSLLNYPELTLVLTKYAQDQSPEHFISTFNLEKPERQLTKKIDFSDKFDKNEFPKFENKVDKNGRFILIQSTKTSTVSDYEGHHMTSGYFAYDSEKEEIIDLPSFKKETILLTDQDHLYLGKDLGEVLDLYEVNPDTKELESIGELTMKSPLIGRDQAQNFPQNFNERITISDGKLYAYGQEQIQGVHLPVFQINDLKTLEALFLGRIDHLNPKSTNKKNIDIFEFQVN